MTDLQWFFINFFQALAAGLLVGGIYGLMCVGLGIIFGVMRVVNFAHGDFMMLGMYVAYYLFTGFGVLLFLGPYAGPIVAAALAGPIVFVIGWLLHRYLIARVTGTRVVSAEAEGHYTQIILTLGIALVLENGGIDPVRFQAAVGADPNVAGILGSGVHFLQSGANGRLRHLHRLCHRPASLPVAYQSRQGAAGSRR